MDDNYAALANYFGGLAKKGPANADVAKYILLKADTSKPLGPGANKTADNEPSLMGRIFDILSRPNYAVANFFKEASEGNPNIESIWEGLSGKEKTTFKDVLSQAGTDDVTAGVGGFLLDVGLDPLTYVSGAGIAKAVKGIKGSEEATKAIKATENLGLPPKVEQDIPAALKSEKPPEIKPQAPAPAPITQAGQGILDLPGVPKFVVEKTPAAAPVEKVAKELKGQLSLRLGVKPTPVKRSTETIDDLAKGDPEAIARTVPIPNPKLDERSKKLADDILSNFDPRRASAEINKKYPNTLNAKQQLKLYHKAREVAYKSIYSKGRNPDKVKTLIDEATIKGYIAAEQRLVDMGYIPRIGSGEDVRFSEVIKDLSSRGVPLTDDILTDFGREIRPGTELAQSVENVRAREALKTAPEVKQTVDTVDSIHKEAKSSGEFSDGQMLDFEQYLKKFPSLVTKATGGSPAVQRATSDIINIALDTGKSAAQVALEHNSKALDDIIKTGKQNNKTAEVLTRALEKDHGKLPSWAVNDNKATEFFMSRVASWWGQRDLKPLSLNAIASAAATAAARGQALHKIFTGLSDAQKTEVFNIVRGAGSATSDQTLHAAQQIRNMMDNITGVRPGGSVMNRAALDMDQVNKWMKKYNVEFEFNKGKGVDEFGRQYDYSQGSDWLNSWKTADVKDPEKFIFKFQQAVEQATREKAFYQEAGERFGQKVPGGDFTTKIEGHPYLEGYYFPPDVAKQMARASKDWSIPAWQPKSKLLQTYDRILSMWKSGVTIYRPAHHIRNYVGDIYLGWLDGVNSPYPYMLAARVQRTMKDAYPDLMDVDKLVEVGLLSRNFATPKPGAVLFRNRSGVPFTAEQIGAVAHQKGLLEHAQTLEDIIDLGDSGRKSILNAKPFGGKVQKFARGASELVNHNARLAHFIDKVAKSKGKDLESIFEEASRRARKWHPSGLDLSDFEKRYLRRIIPFYSWIRKSTPLLIEGLVMNPGKTLVPSKLYEGIQQTQGIDTPGRDDPFPVDQMFPQWIRAQGLGPLSLPEGVLGSVSNQTPPGYAMAGVGLNPLADLMSQVEDPRKTILSSLTPAVGVPVELLTGRKNFTQEPILGNDAKPGSFSQYVGEQIPIWSAIQGVIGITPTLGETKKVEKSGGDARIESLINWLTAAGIRGTGPYEKQALFEKRDATAGKRKQLTADFLERLKG